MVCEAIKNNFLIQLLITATILTSGAICNILQLLIHLFVKPFSRRLFQKFNGMIHWSWLSQIIFVYECWSESEIIIYCKPDDFRLLGKEHSLTVINHSYEIDFIILWLLIDKFKGLGSSRGFVKNELKYVPIWGWFFGLAEHIFLQRSFEKDKQIIEDKVQDYLTNIENNWLVLLAEGTRFSIEKHAVCEKFAKERNLEPLKHHLIPRSKGFAVTVPILKKHNCQMLYNVQLAFDKNAPHQATLGTLLRGQKIVAHVYIDRISMEKVEPTFEYLYDLYKEKDAMMESFNNFGNFFEGRKEKVLKGIKMEVRQTVKINSIFWIAFIFCCIMYQAIQLILAGHIMFLLGTSSTIIFVFYLMLRHILRESKIAKSGSEYGKSR